ncbi:MAG TPA: hypothetical protein VLI90_11670, partial [Tepidisphaeraceae bacterium]|nr:hypothetical protein [Tepidisphaeraceae bacterium]
MSRITHQNAMRASARRSGAIWARHVLARGGATGAALPAASSGEIASIALVVIPRSPKDQQPFTTPVSRYGGGRLGYSARVR